MDISRFCLAHFLAPDFERVGRESRPDPHRQSAPGLGGRQPHRGDVRAIEAGRRRRSTARPAFARSSCATAPARSSGPGGAPLGVTRADCCCGCPIAGAASSSFWRAAMGRRCWRARTSSRGSSATARSARNCVRWSSARCWRRAPSLSSALPEIETLLARHGARESRDPGPGARRDDGQLSRDCLLMHLWRSLRPGARIRRPGRRRADRAAVPPVGRTPLSRQPPGRRFRAPARRVARAFAQRLPQRARPPAAALRARAPDLRGARAAARDRAIGRTGRLQPRLSRPRLFQPLLSPLVGRVAGLVPRQRARGAARARARRSGRGPEVARQGSRSRKR